MQVRFLPGAPPISATKNPGINRWVFVFVDPLHILFFVEVEDLCHLFQDDESQYFSLFLWWLRSHRTVISLKGRTEVVAESVDLPRAIGVVGG